MKKTTLPIIGAVICSLFLFIQSAAGQSSVITYQGQLTSNGVPSSGNFDIAFILYNDPFNGTQQGSPCTNFAVGVTNGLFTTAVNFTLAPFTGQSLWMQLYVRPSGNGSFTSLSPRQPITSTPYAIQALTANTAAMATTAATANSTVGFSGSLSGDVTGPMNNTSVGSVGGVPAATIASGVNLANSLLSTGGQSYDLNLFAGLRAGNTSLTGMQNVGMGEDALNVDTTGSINTAFGFQALQNNTTGSYNTATGNDALLQNTTSSYNTATGVSAMYVGQSAGYNTATGALALNTASGNAYDTATGVYALAQVENSTDNTANGSFSLQYLASGNNNVAEGAYALGQSETGSNNTAVGFQSLNGILLGSGNIALGYQAGSGLGPSGGSNIDIGHPGLYADNNIIRIGTPGVHTDTYLAGSVHGDGGNLTNINAMQLTGTVPLTQLPAVLVTNDSAVPVTLNGDLNVSNLNVSGSLNVSNSPGITYDQVGQASIGGGTPLPTTFTTFAVTTNSQPGPGYFLVTGMINVMGVGDGDTITVEIVDADNHNNGILVNQTGASTTSLGFNSPYNTIPVSCVIPVGTPGTKKVISLLATCSTSSGVVTAHSLTVLYVPRLNN